MTIFKNFLLNLFVRMLKSPSPIKLVKKDTKYQLLTFITFPSFNTRLVNSNTLTCHPAVDIVLYQSNLHSIRTSGGIACRNFALNPISLYAILLNSTLERSRFSLRNFTAQVLKWHTSLDAAVLNVKSFSLLIYVM